MHELSVTESLLAIALQRAEAAGASRIEALYIVIGELSSFVDESVQFYWDILSRDTIAEGARLHFRRVTPRLRCRDCGMQYEPLTEDLSCPECSSIRVDVLAGDEFHLEAVDVSDSEKVPKGENDGAGDYDHSGQNDRSGDYEASGQDDCNEDHEASVQDDRNEDYERSGENDGNGVYERNGENLRNSGD